MNLNIEKKRKKQKIIIILKLILIVRILINYWNQLKLKKFLFFKVQPMDALCTYPMWAVQMVWALTSNPQAV